MSEPMECAVCHKPTTQRCGNCKFLLLCSRDCQKQIWKSHKPDCQALVRAREAMLAAGLENPTPDNGNGMPLTMSGQEFAALFARSEAVRERHRHIEQRLLRNDPTLLTRDKITHYIERLQSLDATSDEHASRSLVQKMALNRKYNALYHDACDRLMEKELHALSDEMRRRRVGEYFKQNP